MNKLLCLCLTSAILSVGTCAVAQKKSFVDVEGLDPQVKPGDNFFRYVNGRWYDTVKIASDQSGVGSYSFLNAESSLSAMPSFARRRSNAGVTNTIPTLDLAKPLSISRSEGEPNGTSFSLNQTETPLDSSKSCNSLAHPFRSSQAWQRKTSRRSGRDDRFSTFSRTGVSVRTSAGV